MKTKIIVTGGCGYLGSHTVVSLQEIGYEVVVFDNLSNSKELQVYGDDYETKDGTAVRDYIHVVDLAKAHVKAVRRLLNKKQETHAKCLT